MAGRRPLPTQTKLLSGKRHRPLNLNEPRPPVATPQCPEHLDDVAKTEWDRVSAELAAAGLLTSIDRAALSAYCAAWSRWVGAEESIQKFGTVIKSPKSGFPIQNPYVAIANTALGLMHRFMVEFGMTPSSRSRINISPDHPATKDAFEAFMRELPHCEVDGMAQEMTFNDDNETELCTTGD